MNILIILGNGFDLQAKLNSTFDNFFRTEEIPLIEKWFHNPEDKSVKNEISLISLLLYNTYYREFKPYINQWTGQYIEASYEEEFKKALECKEEVVDWMDVESFLSAALQSNGMNKILKCFENSFNTLQRARNCICDFDCIPILFAQASHCKQYQNIESFFEFMMEELHLFEKRFKNYLKAELEKNEKYESNASKIINSIIPYSGNHFSILNFNYTIVNSSLFENIEHIDQNINVHGTIEDNPIIGIYLKDLKNKDSLIQFTKTYRKLISDSKTTILNQKYDEIIIYGHSLGEQDYPYFQSVFDYVDLYNGKTGITYIYSNNYIKTTDIHKIEEHKKEVAKKLFDLINNYGETLDNKDHGKNLLHKLLLEGRITLKLRNFID